jgi:hypothetical protein
MKTLLVLIGLVVVGFGLGELLLRACAHPFPAGQAPAHCDKKCS